MATSLNTITRFDNYSPSMLADLIGKLDRDAKAATAELEAAKDAFKSRGLTSAEGDCFSVLVQKSIRTTLDVTSIRTEMGATWCDDRSKLSEVSTLRIAAIPVSIAA